MSSKITATGGTGFFSRLYRGDTEIPFVPRRRLWYIITSTLLVAALALIFGKGFNLGIEFEGGTSFEVPVSGGVELPEAESVVEGTGATISSGQIVGSGDAQRFVIRTEQLDDAGVEETRQALTSEIGEEVTVSEVSSSWGGAVTQQALIAMAVFVLLVALFLWLRFEPKMAAAALLALTHDLIMVAGIYALVGFEVTPGTVVGILTILAYSLYDTVVVFDKVRENTKNILLSKRRSYPQATNRAINQVLMRSINTTLTGLLPMAGLLFVGVGLLGVGTLKDLALVLFVGLLVGAYSSLFVAAPLLVDLKLADPKVRNHAAKVEAKQLADGRDGFSAAAYDAAEDEVVDSSGRDDDDASEELDKQRELTHSEFRPAAAPKPGARTTTTRGSRKKKRR